MAVTTTASYQDTLKDIEDTVGFVPGFMAAVPEDALIHEWPVFKQYELGENEIPAKYAHLMQLAVAATQKCQYCEAFHSAAASLNGATEAELAETGLLASLTTRWSTLIHAQQYDYDTFVDEVHQVGGFLKEQQQAAD